MPYTPNNRWRSNTDDATADSDDDQFTDEDLNDLINAITASEQFLKLRDILKELLDSIRELSSAVHAYYNKEQPNTVQTQ